jgi:hypothetical protein
MKYLLSGVAMVALLAAALPATAQTTSDTTTSALKPATSGHHAGKHMSHKSTARAKHGATAEDTSADELNRRELDRLAQTATPTTGPGAGTTIAPRPAAPQQ